MKHFFRNCGVLQKCFHLVFPPQWKLQLVMSQKRVACCFQNMKTWAVPLEILPTTRNKAMDLNQLWGSCSLHPNSYTARLILIRMLHFPQGIGPLPFVDLGVPIDKGRPDCSPQLQPLGESLGTTGLSVDLIVNFTMDSLAIVRNRCPLILRTPSQK